MRSRFVVLLIFGMVAVSGAASADVQTCFDLFKGVCTLNGGPGSPTADFGRVSISIQEGGVGCHGGGESTVGCPVNASVELGAIVLCEGGVTKTGCDANGISDVLLFTCVPVGCKTTKEVALLSDPNAEGVLPKEVSYVSESSDPIIIDVIGRDNPLAKVRYTVFSDVEGTETPEPGSLLLLGTGLLSFFPVIRRKLRM